MEKWILHNLKKQLNVFLQLFCQVSMKAFSVDEFI